MENLKKRNLKNLKRHKIFLQTGLFYGLRFPVVLKVIQISGYRNG